MTIRVAGIEVSHWHSLFDAAYLRHLVKMPDVTLVAVQDSDGALARKRAAEVGNPQVLWLHVRPSCVTVTWSLPSIEACTVSTKAPTASNAS